MTHRREVEAILAGGRAERAALLDQLSPACGLRSPSTPPASPRRSTTSGRPVGGDALRHDVLTLLEQHPPAAAEPELRAAYGAQEDAALRIATHLDEHSR
jgi:hypothetical protein